MTKTTHPLAAPSHAQINLYTKGRRANIIRDSFLLMKQAAPQLAKGQNILYVNTLTSADVVEEFADKISARYDREVCTFTASSRNFMQRLDFLEHTISSKGIKLLILNAFEFAAIFSRQKTTLATWLREMRDAYGLRVAVYSMNPEQTLGALGTLSWLADRVEKVGDWKFDEDISDTLSIQENPAVAAKEFIELLDSDPDDTRDASEFVDRPSGLNIVNVGEMLRQYSLKNKELGYAATRVDASDEIELLEKELEMV
jgi:hypothetical protein